MKSRLKLYHIKSTPQNEKEEQSEPTSSIITAIVQNSMANTFA
jgi:hypothetical protein